MSKNKNILITTCLFLLPLNVLATDDLSQIDFKGREDHYLEYCNYENLSDLDKEVCAQFNKYLKEETSNLQDQINDLAAQEEDIKNNIEKYLPLLQEYEADIENKEADIAELETTLSQINDQITSSTNELLNISDDIQTTINTQKMRADYLMGKNYGGAQATSYTLGDENSKKIENALDSYLNTLDITKDEMKEIQNNKKRIAEIDATREVETAEFNNTDAIKEKIVAEKEAVAQKRKVTQEIINEYKRQQADIESAKNDYVQDQESLRLSMDNIAKSIGTTESSGSFENMVKGGKVSAGTWAYPSGGTHLGVDIAAPIGTAITAPANGVVLFSTNSCDNNGYLGNSCGAPGTAGGGNQVYIAVNVNGQVYAVKVIHMNANSPLSAGTEFRQGDKIGEVGNSGNSTGAHAHIEVYKIDAPDIQTFVDNWDGDLSFGTGLGTEGLNGRCLVKSQGNCREDALQIFGLQVGSSY